MLSFVLNALIIVFFVVLGCVGLAVLFGGSIKFCGWYDKQSELKDGYKAHVRLVKDICGKYSYDGVYRCNRYVVLTFDTFVNMYKLDKNYWDCEKFSQKYAWKIHHEGDKVVKDGYLQHGDTFVVFKTLKDYKKWCEFMSTSDKSNDENSLYFDSSDEAMKQIIEHYKEVSEQKHKEYADYINKGRKCYEDISDNLITKGVNGNE